MTISGSSLLRTVLAGIAILCFVLSATPASAQRLSSYHGFRQAYPGAPAVGLQAGVNGNLGIDGPRAACDCTFDGGSGIGYHAGIHFDFFVNRWFGIRLQGLFEDYSTEYVKDRRVESYLSNGRLVMLDVERRSDVALRYMSASFHAVWFTGPRGLYLLTGAGAGFYIDGTLVEKEYIKDGAGVFPESGTSVLVYRDDKLDAADDPDVRASLIFGVGYDIPLGRGAAIAPEVQIDFPLTSVMQGNADWRIAAVRGGISLRFGL